MKKIIALLLACSLMLSGCASSSKTESKDFTNATSTLSETKMEDEDGNTSVEKDDISLDEVLDDQTISNDFEEIVPEFSSLDDAELLQYIEDSVYADLINNFESEDYIVEDVQTVYISKDYINELSYNSKSNIYFGYTLEEIEEQFNGQRYIFTLGDDGTTVVQPFEDYDDTYEQVLKNVAIGTGVILVCVTVSVVSGGIGAPAAVSMVFAASAKTGTVMALSSGTISAVAAAAVTGYKTKDTEQALKAAALKGSESFKWGAITGVITGGVSEAITIRNAAKATETVAEVANTIPTPREAELLALEKYGGTEQVTFLGGEEVAFGTPGATRPDVWRMVDGHWEAIEVKDYNLQSARSLNTLYSELERQVAARVENLPAGSTQRIVLNVQGRDFSAELIADVTENIQSRLMDIYPNIPIDIMGF